MPIIEVWNKWDLLTPDRAEELDGMIEAREDAVVALSALTGEGGDALLDLLGRALTEDARLVSFVIPAADGQRLAWLHAHGEVLGEDPAGEGPDGPMLKLRVRLTARELGRFEQLPARLGEGVPTGAAQA